MWWLSEILGACLAVLVMRMAFAPVFMGDQASSGTWWWRAYLYYNRMMDEYTFEETAEGAHAHSWGKVFEQRRHQAQMSLFEESIRSEFSKPLNIFR